MNYVDTYLKATDQDALTLVLTNAGVLDEEGMVTQGHWLDLIGTIGSWDYADPENPVFTPVAGYHANLRSLEAVDGLGAITLEPPATPYRVWA